MDIPDVGYPRSGDVAIAYQTIGEGPVDVIFVRGFAGDLLSSGSSHSSCASSKTWPHSLA